MQPRSGDNQEHVRRKTRAEPEGSARADSTARSVFERPRTWIALSLATLLMAMAVEEIHSSRLQALLWTRFTDDLHYSVTRGAAERPVVPPTGPYDARLGYTDLSEKIGRLERRGFKVAAQARWSPNLATWAERGFHPVYREKDRAGLILKDRSGSELFVSEHPVHAFADFDSVPRVLVETLLYIENGELLDDDTPLRNPAIEWDRLAHATAVRTVRSLYGGGGPGGSTLATQLEKYRHTPRGVTHSVSDKLRQIASASARTYMHGPDTRDARQRIALDYINTVPLSARAGFGEVHGLGDGLWAWYGTDLTELRRAFSDPATPESKRGRFFKQSLSLFVAQRRPSHYLIEGRRDLEDLTDRYLRLLAREGAIPPELRDAALASRLEFLPEPPPRTPVPIERRKASDAVRNELVQLLGLRGRYDLDRLDLEVETTLDVELLDQTGALLQELRDPESDLSASLRTPRMLGNAPADEVVYSLLLFERTPEANLLRVQVDTLDRPFDVNSGLKLDLGSTAKLRTTIHYLEVVEGLHARYAGMDAADLRGVRIDRRAKLQHWVVRQLQRDPELELAELLERALDRVYSARPGKFVTGGGLHSFGNFNRKHDRASLSIRSAFRHSVNLPFVRLMRDLVEHYQFGPQQLARDAFENLDGAWRRAFLERFADIESAAFLRQFHGRLSSLDTDERLEHLVSQGRNSTRRLSVLFRSLREDGSREDFADFVRDAEQRLSDGALKRLWDRYDPQNLTLVDRAWLARVHPLELWLTGFLDENPGANLSDALEEGREVRREAYSWLFRTRSRSGQDKRIRSVLEREAFKEIHAGWRRAGYPFQSLVPSLATALGASADRPEALAELVGIVLNDGVRRPYRSIERMEFGTHTPYEARLERGRPTWERMMTPSVARAIRGLLVDVVEHGTARRVRGVYESEGEPLEVGGKTGTGDNRHKTFSANGRLLEARAKSRTATFAFVLGERHFGVITAYVEGENAADYDFTSSLPVQVLRLLEPTLRARLLRDAEDLGGSSPLPESVQCTLPDPIAPAPDRDLEALRRLVLELLRGDGENGNWRGLRRWVRRWIEPAEAIPLDPSPAPIRTWFRDGSPQSSHRAGRPSSGPLPVRELERKPAGFENLPARTYAVEVPWGRDPTGGEPEQP